MRIIANIVARSRFVCIHIDDWNCFKRDISCAPQVNVLPRGGPVMEEEICIARCRSVDVRILDCGNGIESSSIDWLLISSGERWWW